MLEDPSSEPGLSISSLREFCHTFTNPLSVRVNYMQLWIANDLFNLFLFSFLRYTQPPQDLWDWYEEYLEDEEVR